MVFSMKFSWILVAVVSLLLCKGVHCQTTSDQKTVGLIAGCVGGGVVLLILITVVCCFACKRREKEKDLYGKNLGHQYPPNISSDTNKNGEIGHHPAKNDIGRGGSGIGTKSPPSSEMASSQLSVPPGIWQANPTIAAELPPQGYPYVLAHKRESPRGTQQSSRDIPPMYGSYSNEPMLTPRKKPNWYNRTWRRAQNALRQIPTVFQVKRSRDKENHPYFPQEGHNRHSSTMPHGSGHRRDNGAVREMERNDIRKEQHLPQRKKSSKSQKTKQKSSRPKSAEVLPTCVPKSSKDDVARVYTGSRDEIARVHSGDPGYSSSTLPAKIVDTGEADYSPAIPSGPYVAKVYSDYREPQDRVHEPIETSENVAKAFSSYQHLDRGSYLRDPYIARANVNNRHSAEVLQEKNIQQITQSDFSLHKHGRPLGRTNSEMVRNGAGMYMQGKYTAPPHYYGNKPIILSPGNFSAAQPYGRGVLLRAPANVGGFNSRQTHSLDRFNNYDQRIVGGLQQKSVFAVHAGDNPDIVRGNFIMRSNTITLQDTTKNKQSAKHKQGTGKNPGVVMREKKPSKEKRPSKKQQKHEQKHSPTIAEEPTKEQIPVEEEIPKHQLRGNSNNGPHALYAKPYKVRENSVLGKETKTEINNNDTNNNDESPPKPQVLLKKEEPTKDKATTNVKSESRKPEPSTSTDVPAKPVPPATTDELPAPNTEVNQDEEKVEPRTRLKSVSSADVHLKEGKDITADAFRFLEEFDDGNTSAADES